MKRILLVCSMFILLFTALAHADISHHNTSLFNAKSKHLSVEKKSTFTKYAGVVFITEYGKDTAFSTLTYPKAPIVCSSSQFPLGVSPEHCCHVETCTDSNSITHYGCTTCCPGYQKTNNACSPNDCSDYELESCEIEHCVYLESGDCHKKVDSCQKGEDKVYKCLECEQGYEVNSSGGCSAIVCNSTLYPYPSRPTICSGELLVCRGGDNLYYGCEACEFGYIKSGGQCIETVCASEYSESSCPAHGTCDTCQSGETTKYKLTGCDPTYELNAGGTACVRQKAFAFEVTTTAANQSVSVYLTGKASIDWGDGNAEEKTTSGSGSKSHSFSSAGKYNVYVTGTPTAAKISSGKDYVTKLLDISLPSITSYYQAFYECSNMTGDITDMTFPSGLTNAYAMFSATQISGQIPTLPNTITRADWMFSETNVTGSVPALPTSLSGVGAAGMFNRCSGLTGDITNLQIPNAVTDTKRMFRECTGLTGSIPTLPSGLTDASSMFSGCTGLTGSIPELPSTLTNGDAMFYGCSGLTGDITNLVLPSGLTTARDMFGHTAVSGNIPTLPDTITDGWFMFAYCPNLTGSVPNIPTGLTEAGGMFSNSTGLTGQCPTKPVSLTEVGDMYLNTGVCCDYGDAPSTCVPDHAVAFTVTTTAANKSIALSIAGPFTIDWGDGNTETGTGTTTLSWMGTPNNKDTHSHTYATAGSYDVYVYGTPTYVALKSGQSYVTQLLDVSLPSITSYYQTFDGCSNMTGDLTALTFPSGLKNTSFMFASCSSLNSNVPNLPDTIESAGSMFTFSGVKGVIPSLPSQLWSADSMFSFSNITGFGFAGFPWNLTYAGAMFEGCEELQGSVPTLIGVEEAYQMFKDCPGITGNVPDLPSTLINANLMFENTNLTGTVPDSLPSNIGGTHGMFSGNANLGGACPPKPDSLTNYGEMYSGTNVCCDYGDAPSTCSISFEITVPGRNYNFHIVTSGPFNIDWGDGNVSTGDGTDKLSYHSYNSGNYTISVTGSPTKFTVSTGRPLITKLLNITLPSVTECNNAFNGSTNMTGDLSTMTFPSGLESAESMFEDCSSLTGQCPTPKPGNLTSYTDMYKNSRVTCSYGK